MHQSNNCSVLGSTAFFFLQNSVSSELLENLYVFHEILTQSKNDAATVHHRLQSVLTKQHILSISEYINCSISAQNVDL